MEHIYIDEQGRVFEGEKAKMMIDLEKGLEDMKQFRKQLELNETLKEGKSKLELFKEGFKYGLKADNNHKISMSSGAVSAVVGGIVMYAVTKDIKYSAKAALTTGAKTYVVGRIQCAAIDGIFEAINE